MTRLTRRLSSVLGPLVQILNVSLFLWISVVLSLPGTQVQAVTTVFGPKKYTGSQPNPKIYNETLNIGASDLNRKFTIKIVNADGQPHLMRTCKQSNIFTRFACFLSNATNTVYLSLARVQKFELKNNGTVLISSAQVNQTIATFTATINLAAVNKLNLSVVGFVTSSLTVEILKDDAPVDTTPPLIAYSIPNGKLTNNPNTVVSITDGSSTLTTVSVDGVAVVSNTSSKSIPVTLREGMNTVVIKSKDVYENASPDLIINDIRLDTILARISSDLVSSYVVASLPYRKLFSFTSNEELTLIQVNNVNLVQVGLNSYSYLAEFSDENEKSFQVRAIDKAGNESTQVFTSKVTLDNTPPEIALSPTPARIIASDSLKLNVSIADASFVKSQIFIDDVASFVSNEKSFSYDVAFPTDQAKKIKITAIDQAGNESQVVYTVTKDTRPFYISVLAPQNKSIVASAIVEVRAVANKPLSRAKVNGKVATIGSDQISIKANIAEGGSGEYVYAIEATDVYGAQASAEVRVTVKTNELASWAYEECPSY